MIYESAANGSGSNGNGSRSVIVKQEASYGNHLETHEERIPRLAHSVEYLQSNSSEDRNHTVPLPAYPCCERWYRATVRLNNELDAERAAKEVYKRKYDAAFNELMKLQRIRVNTMHQNLQVQSEIPQRQAPILIDKSTNTTQANSDRAAIGEVSASQLHQKENGKEQLQNEAELKQKSSKGSGVSGVRRSLVQMDDATTKDVLLRNKKRKNTSGENVLPVVSPTRVQSSPKSQACAVVPTESNENRKNASSNSLSRPKVSKISEIWKLKVYEVTKANDDAVWKFVERSQWNIQVRNLRSDTTVMSARLRFETDPLWTEKRSKVWEARLVYDGDLRHGMGGGPRGSTLRTALNHVCPISEKAVRFKEYLGSTANDLTQLFELQVTAIAPKDDKVVNCHKKTINFANILANKKYSTSHPDLFIYESVRQYGSALYIGCQKYGTDLIAIRFIILRITQSK
eukprot:CAMPEP_0182445464 /NCGR_PEP_ID=MMETSP1172-20130603/3577_1 /TAXON_ID=708627 /ORGANISM="Timspurckia oligopyrenoides, Strain CCMP3278" /LENGTH=457 /DNA_ID=CAMNT_0024641237 /DNA_START=24 /DNA_END=1397 /DNA_ORIENTATION=-